MIYLSYYNFLLCYPAFICLIDDYTPKYCNDLDLSFP
jgi:hypothetical protein